MKARGVLLLAVSAAWLVAAALVPAQKPAQPKLDFSRDILPILSDKCFKCHGPDATGRMANLRLDTAEGAFAPRNGKWAIVPGKPQDSLLVQKINDPDDPMPPESSGKSLTAEEKATLTRWIAEGARYGKLWSFQDLPGSVPVPKVKGDWPKSDIDRFILARLQKEGLSPSKPASKLRWLRRVTLDLTGLPPTEEEIAAFQADEGKDAYEKVVDRLLASPHFGERIAVDWLDAARYSDSYGYQSDLLMPTWPYRDWVVKSFNENLPYDRFLTDQIAGDLLPHPTRDQILATAFNRLHRQSNEGGSIALEFKTEYAVDRVDTFGTAVLGLTVGCARCHDHKFDPISQREFYQLFAYFNSIDEYGLLLSTEIVPTPSLLLPTPAQEKRLKELRAQDDAAKKALAAAIAGCGPRYSAWLAKKPSLSIPGILARIGFDKEDKGHFVNEAGGAAFGERLGKVEMTPGHEGQGVLLGGDNGIAVRGLPVKERWEPFSWSFWVSDPRQTEPVVLLHRTGGTDVGFCGFDLMLEDGHLTARVMRHWPGNAVAIRTKAQVPKDRWTHIGWTWDGSGRASGLALYVDGKPAECEVLNDHLWKKIDAYGDLGDSRGDWTFGERFRDAGFKGGKLDDLVFANRCLSPAEVAQLCDGPRPGSDLRGYYASAVDPVVAAAREAMLKSQHALTDFEDGIYEISVMREASHEIPAYLLARGRYDAPRNAETRVKRDVPKSLPPLDARGPNDRLALARWATRPNHPLTARVAVNRLWQMIFGAGLVETSENFGMQGSRPTHPELLDYLARRFVNSGWNVKKLLREMVLSATYRQDSALAPTLVKKDPQNRLYARGPSERLSAEMVRDTALAASGLLNAKIGGPPVNPYQPAGIWQENNTMSPPFVQSKGADLYRRSLYSTWKRTTPVPSMLIFDATTREACEVRRPTTSTPLQALVLLNDVQFVEAARVLAEHVVSRPDPERVTLMFRRLAGRDPDAREAAILLQTLKEQRTLFASDAASASKLIQVGDSKPPASLNPVELAATTVVAQTILNSDAVIWKR
ncbi:MAG TPA: DUF1553 domain-containing protein [Fimbriimonadaceae bacterium]|nr:DUF1553 domain-containing protein [Fimbriimonadaceae bacterium]